MELNEILAGDVVNEPSLDEQKEVLEQMKEQKLFDLEDNNRLNLIDFLCEKVDTELAIDYLFHVLDEEISYPFDDEKVKSLFSDERMGKLKDGMMEKLQDEEGEEEPTNEEE